MIEVGNSIEDSGLESTTVQSDPAADWARYEGQFARLDGSIRHRTACLIAFDGVLIVVLALLAIGPLSGYRDFATSFAAFLPWLGLSASIVLYWAQYRTYEYRRELQRAWKKCNPEFQPAPYGLETRDLGTLVGAPDILFALLSSLTWLILFGFAMAHHFVVDDKITIFMMGRLPYMLSGILGCVTVVLFYCASVTHFANKDAERGN